MAKRVKGLIKLQVAAGAANPSPPVAGIKSGSGRPNTEKVGTVTRAQLEEIATTKEPDLTAASLEAAVKTIAGSARSMGLKVEG